MTNYRVFLCSGKMVKSTNSILPSFTFSTDELPGLTSDFLFVLVRPGSEQGTSERIEVTSPTPFPARPRKRRRRGSLRGKPAPLRRIRFSPGRF